MQSSPTGSPVSPFPFRVWAIASGGRLSRVEGGQPATEPGQRRGSRSLGRRYTNKHRAGGRGRRRGALARGPPTA